MDLHHHSKQQSYCSSLKNLYFFFMSASPIHFCWFFNTKLSRTPAQLFSAHLLTTMKSRNTFSEPYPAQPILIFVFARNAWTNFSLGSFVSYHYACDVLLIEDWYSQWEAALPTKLSRNRGYCHLRRLPNCLIGNTAALWNFNGFTCLARTWHPGDSDARVMTYKHVGLVDNIKTIAKQRDPFNE